MINKLFLIVKHYFIQISKSKFRFILTVFGICFASFILTAGYMIIDSYYYSHFHKYDVYQKEKAVFISGQMDASFLQQMHETFGYHYVSYQSDRQYRIANYQIGETVIHVNINIVKSDMNFNDFLVPTYEDHNMLYKPTLIYGRTISKEDIDFQQKVIVIEEVLANFLFGNAESAIGKYIYIPIYEEIRSNGIFTREIISYEALEIIGVVSSSTYQQHQIKELYQNLEKGNEDQLTLYGMVYLPRTVTLDLNEEETDYRQIVYTQVEERKQKYDELSQYILYRLDSNINIHHYDSIYQSIVESLEETKRSLQVVVYMIIFISGISIMNTMFFSVKERINEIGIRKAIGATNENIITQFLFEGTIYGIIGTLVGLFVGFLSVITLRALNVYTFKLVFIPQSIAIAVILPIAMSMFASLLPAIYASNIKITDAIKFD